MLEMTSANIVFFLFLVNNVMEDPTITTPNTIWSRQKFPEYNDILNKACPGYRRKVTVLFGSV